MDKLIRKFEEGTIGNKGFARAVCARAGLDCWPYNGELFVRYNDVVYIIGSTKKEFIKKGKDIKTYMEFIVELGLIEDTIFSFDNDYVL